MPSDAIEPPTDSPPPHHPHTYAPPMCNCGGIPKPPPFMAKPAPPPKSPPPEPVPYDRAKPQRTTR